MIRLSQMFAWVVKKCPNLTVKGNFLYIKIDRIFLIFFSLKNISLEEGFCYCQFLKTSIFEPLCFLKWCPIFDGPCEHLWKSNQKIIFILLIFLLKSTPCWLKSAKLHHWGHTKLCINAIKKTLIVFNYLCKRSSLFS